MTRNCISDVMNGFGWLLDAETWTENLKAYNQLFPSDGKYFLPLGVYTGRFAAFTVARI